MLDLHSQVDDTVQFGLGCGVGLALPSFLQAEVVAGANVLTSTAGRGRRFEAGKINERIQKVQRYSFQRPFQEASPQRTGWLN